MKKQNRSPNQLLNPSKQKKSNPNLKPQQHSTHPFKPRFIVKDTSALSYQDIMVNQQSEPTHSYSHLAVPTIHQPESYPTSSQFIDNSQPIYSCVQTRSNSFRRNWKEQYELLRRQMISRTKKFNQIVDLCRNILGDLDHCAKEGCQEMERKYRNDGEVCECQDRMEYIGDKVEMLLRTFDLFRQQEE